MKILIAEDEFIERKSMRKFIDENFSDIYVIGEAVNGREAIEQAKSLHPDVILMDIKMPGIDGIEAIRQIYAFDSSIKFIMVSAYDSFDYAKEAMTYGIKDYILKPGKKEEIVKALLRVKKDIENEKQQQIEQQQSKEWEKERFLKMIMQQPISNDAIRIQKDLYPDMKEAFFLVLMSDEYASLHQVESIFETYFEADYILLENDSYLISCVISTKSLEKDEILVMARQLSETLGEHVFIGAGFPYPSLKELQKSYHEAYAACFQLKNDNKRKYGFLMENNQRVTNIAEDLYQAVEKGNVSEASLIYKENVHLLQEVDKEYLYIKLKELFHIHQIAMPNSSISSLQSEDDWYNFLHMCGIKINEFYQSKQSMIQVKNYLIENYHQSISLEEVAEMIDLSSNYFSNVFKQEFGLTFTDYITKLRMEKAKELIKENSYALKEISFLIGYKDPNYFSRVFKKHFHQSPKQFQSEIFK